MSTINLTLSTEGLEDAIQASAARAERLRNLKPVFEAGDEAFRAEMDTQFRTQGTHLLGEQWAPLSPDYAATKPPVPPPFGILYRTGKMWKSLTDASDDDHIVEATDSYGLYGTRVDYAHWHQDGSSDSNLPQRKIIQVSKAFTAVMRRLLLHWVLTGENVQGGK